MRKLAIAWIVTLSFFVGAISWLQLTYEPESAADGAETEAQTEEHAAAELERIAPGDDDLGPMPTAGTPSGALDTAEQAPADSGEIAPQDSPQAEPEPVGVANLLEDGPYGPIPVTRSGRQPWRAHSRDFDKLSNSPRVSIIIAGLGLNQRTTVNAIGSLPSAVTLAFSPYGQNLEGWADEAREAGHELLVMVPMEPLDYPVNDPGPHSLLTSLSPADNIDKLHYVMSRFQGYVGLINDMGSRFTASEDSLRPIMSDLQRRGVIFVDSRTTSATILPAVAQSYGVPTVSNSRYIDNVASASEIDRYLAELEDIARARGSSVGIGRSYPVTIARVVEWSRTLEERGIALAPITAVVRP